MFVLWAFGVVSGILDCVYQVTHTERWQRDISSGENRLQGESVQYIQIQDNACRFREFRKPQLAAKGDERLTKVGRFLREHHLDELPQLWNVFVGDMSFVGPRPERQYYIDKIRERNPNYDYVYLMRPGLTSMATIYNGYTDTLEKMLTRLDMDLEYLRKRSLFLDLKIIVTTVLYILKGKKF